MVGEGVDTVYTVNSLEKLLKGAEKWKNKLTGVRSRKT